eukprot:11568780-Alexandrium_andersonii.AAC.1
MALPLWLWMRIHAPCTFPARGVCGCRRWLRWREKDVWIAAVPGHGWVLAQRASCWQGVSEWGGAQAA